MAKLKTIYKIRAEIPARVVEASGLLSKAREIGLNLKPDDVGNVEGAWDASLLTLAAVLKMLQEAGVQKPLIQKRVITVTVAAKVSKTREMIGLLREAGILDISQAKDVFLDEEVFRCNVSCEEAERLLAEIEGLGISKVIATESYEVAT